MVGSGHPSFRCPRESLPAPSSRPTWWGTQWGSLACKHAASRSLAVMPFLALFQMEGRAVQWWAARVLPKALLPSISFLTQRHLHPGLWGLTERVKTGCNELGVLHECRPRGPAWALYSPEEIPRRGHWGPKKRSGLLGSRWPSLDGDPGPLVSVLSFLYSHYFLK